MGVAFRYARSTMLRAGIVGLPNVGKSTLFKTLTKKQVPCENFPFCTIEPNVGMVEVPDARLGLLAAKSVSQKIIPAAVEFVDIAGIVKGAHKGEGLGNKFLSNIRETDLIVHVVRAFEDANVHHVDGGVDPMRDAEMIEIELAMADLEVVEKRLRAVEGKMKAGVGKELERDLALLKRLYAALEQGRMANAVAVEDDDRAALRQLNLLTAKPMLYVVNVDEAAASDAAWQSPLGPDRLALPLSVKIESEIVEMPEAEHKSFLEALGLKQSGLDRLIAMTYELLGLITYFTSGEKETRAWTIARGTKAPQAAGVIHTDFEKTFIRAEVIDWKDFVALGEAGAREAGKLRIEGKEYVMRDGDVCHFRVGA